MNVKGNNILITGGATGIGLALAERFLNAGSKVTICGRREQALREAQAKNPELNTRVCDVGSPAERIALMDWVTREHAEMNVLVNNAGIQRRGGQSGRDRKTGRAIHQEIAINLEAPIHLARLFAAHLGRQKRPAIINVTSGLAFVPLAMVPVYCATKAALHSFTFSLRHHLARTPIQVIEIIPPAVNTDLGGKGLHDFGVPLNEFSDSIFSRCKAMSWKLPMVSPRSRAGRHARSWTQCSLR